VGVAAHVAKVQEVTMGVNKGQIRTHRGRKPASTRSGQRVSTFSENAWAWPGSMVLDDFLSARIAACADIVFSAQTRRLNTQTAFWSTEVGCQGRKVMSHHTQNFLGSVSAKNMFFEYLGLFSCFFRACLPAVVFRSGARHFALCLEANGHVVLELFKKNDI
jgi:hypothetical protein